MPYDGNGNYSLPANSFTQPVADVAINSTDATAFWADLTTALSSCVVDAETVSPELLNPKLNSVLLDSNGNELLGSVATGSAVNYLTISNNITGSPPYFVVQGGESDIGLVVFDSNNNEMLNLISTASAVNNIRMTNAATGDAALIDVTETNTDLALAGNGTGGVYGTIKTHPSSPFTVSSTSVPVTGIPSWVKRVIIPLYRISLDGTNDTVDIQIGDSVGLHTTGYENTFSWITDGAVAGTTTGTTKVIINYPAGQTATCSYSGEIVITREDSSNFNYTIKATIGDHGGSDQIISTASVTLDTVMTQFALNVVGGGSFDAGSFGVEYEG